MSTEGAYVPPQRPWLKNECRREDLETDTGLDSSPGWCFPRGAISMTCVPPKTEFR
jgi:hypothetical protein